MIPSVIPFLHDLEQKRYHQYPETLTFYRISWLGTAVRDAEVACSNQVAPTKHKMLPLKGLRHSHRSPFFRFLAQRPQALDESLIELAAEDELAAKDVELRYFAGLGHEQIAEFTGVSVYEARKKWTYARAWLREKLSSS